MATMTQTQTKLDLGNLPATPIGPLTTGKNDFATYAAQEMAMVHNCLMWTWNSIYQQAPLVVKKDYSDFIGYALQWHRIVEIHHDGEEEGLYPSMEKFMDRPGYFSAAVEEHGLFHSGLDQYKAYLVECKADPSKFDGNMLVTIMSSFGEALYTHMAAEPNLLLTIPDEYSAGLRKLWDDHTKEVLGSASLTTEIPVIWVNCNTLYENGSMARFPEIPAPVKFYMRHIAARWHNHYWRFGSTTYGGQPQTLLCMREGYGK